MAERRLKYAAGLTWFLLFGGLALWIDYSGYSLREIMDLTYHHVVDNPIAPVIYIVIYTLRSLTFFPAMWLTIAAGSLFGFWPGVIFALIGENLSANFAYLLARYFRTDRLAPASGIDRIRKFKRLLRQNAFVTVVILRACYLPFDLVNYGCGLLRVAWPAYAGASLIGMLPPMVTFVSFGASIRLPALLRNENFSPESLIDTTQLAISGGLLVSSLAIAIWAHRRRQRLVQTGQPLS